MVKKKIDKTADPFREFYIQDQGMSIARALGIQKKGEPKLLSADEKRILVIKVEKEVERMRLDRTTLARLNMYGDVSVSWEQVALDKIAHLDEKERSVIGTNTRDAIKVTLKQQPKVRK